MFYNEALLCVTGHVATEPRYRTVGNGIPLLTMRVAWTNRHRDGVTGEWANGNTSFVNVTCWRKLAENLSTCLRKGDPVLLRGRLDIRPFTGRDGQRRISVDVEATSLGHDLTRGVARFQRAWASPGKTAEEHAAEPATGEPGGDLAPLAGDPGDGDPGGGGDMFDDTEVGALAQDEDSLAGTS